jgi:hypothetical protein
MCADLRMMVPSRTWYVQEVLFMPALWYHGSCSNPCTDDADDAACGFPEYARVHLALNAWIDPPPK